jgi:phosphatidylglycerol:prolipoprotein diacylglycerol transferase
MRPILFRWGRFTVSSYPAMLYFGMVCGLVAGNLLAHRAGVDAFRVYIATLILLVPALIGARLFFVFSHWSHYRTHLEQIWSHKAGGAAMYGGLLVVLPASLPVLAALNVPAGTYWDIAIFTMLVTMIIGRIGCVMNGCCAGRQSQSWIAVNLPDHNGTWAGRLPTQYLEAVWGILLLVIALAVRGSMPFPGALFLLILAGYAGGRLLLEFTREQTPIGRITMNHAISLGLIMFSVAVLSVEWTK